MKIPAEKLYTAAAFILAVVAFGYSMYNGAVVGRRLEQQDKKLERFFRLSLQPNMAFAFLYNEEGSGWSLYNTGTGPAIIKWFSVSVDGKLQPDWNEFRAALGLSDRVRYYFSVPYANSVIHRSTDNGTDGDKSRLFWIPPGPEADSLKTLNRRVGMMVCYCSQYSECWLAGGNQKEPARDSCESAPVPTFRPPR